MVTPRASGQHRRDREQESLRSRRGRQRDRGPSKAPVPFAHQESDSARTVIIRQQPHGDRTRRQQREYRTTVPAATGRPMR